jgi:hypothetical protein
VKVCEHGFTVEYDQNGTPICDQCEPVAGEQYACCCGSAFATTWERAKHWETCARFNSTDRDAIEECGPGCGCSECQLRRRVEQLEATLADLETTLTDVARGSTHELVRYWLGKTVAAENRVELAQEKLAKVQAAIGELSASIDQDEGARESELRAARRNIIEHAAAVERAARGEVEAIQRAVALTKRIDRAIALLSDGSTCREQQALEVLRG